MLAASGWFVATAWDAPYSGEGRRFDGMSGMKTIAFSNDSQFLVTGYEHENADIWNATSGQRAQVISCEHIGARCLSFSLDGHWLAIAGTEGVLLWDWRNRKEKWKVITPGIRCIAFSSDGEYLAIGGRGLSYRKTSDGSFTHKASIPAEWICALSFSPDGRLLAIGDESGEVSVYDAATGDKRWSAAMAGTENTTLFAGAAVLAVVIGLTAAVFYRKRRSGRSRGYRTIAGRGALESDQK
jgi:WD40 repeat protein